LSKTRPAELGWPAAGVPPAAAFPEGAKVPVVPDTAEGLGAAPKSETEAKEAIDSVERVSQQHPAVIVRHFVLTLFESVFTVNVRQRSGNLQKLEGTKGVNGNPWTIIYYVDVDDYPCPH
jgi:hypothetical protein